MKRYKSQLTDCYIYQESIDFIKSQRELPLEDWQIGSTYMAIGVILMLMLQTIIYYYIPYGTAK